MAYVWVSPLGSVSEPYDTREECEASAAAYASGCYVPGLQLDDTQLRAVVKSMFEHGGWKVRPFNPEPAEVCCDAQV